MYNKNKEKENYTPISKKGSIRDCIESFGNDFLPFLFREFVDLLLHLCVVDVDVCRTQRARSTSAHRGRCGVTWW